MIMSKFKSIVVGLFFMCWALPGAVQYDSKSFLDLIDGKDEIKFTQEVHDATIMVLGSNLTDWRKAGMWVDVERDGERDFRKYIGDDLLRGSNLISLGIDFKPGNELELNWKWKDLRVGALTAEESRFEGLRESYWPKFNESYGVDGYFRNYFGDGSYIDWTIKEVGVWTPSAGPTVSGQPLPGGLVTLAIGSAFMLAMRRRSQK